MKPYLLRFYTDWKKNKIAERWMYSVSAYAAHEAALDLMPIRRNHELLIDITEYRQSTRYYQDPIPGGTSNAR